jgi:hypothetical protein
MSIKEKATMKMYEEENIITFRTEPLAYEYVSTLGAEVFSMGKAGPFVKESAYVDRDHRSQCIMDRYGIEYDMFFALQTYLGSAIAEQSGNVFPLLR